MTPSLRDLAATTGYDPATQRTVGYVARALDEHLTKLKRITDGLTVGQLEWQERPGHNTIGMLLAHCAVAESYWTCVFDSGKPITPDGDEMVRGILGIHPDDDGLPAKPDSTHPATLKGKTLADYYLLLDKARAASHRALRTWTDDKLTATVTRGERSTTYAWVLYHVLEHFVEHTGQVQLIKHLMRDAGVLPPAEA